MFTRGEARRMSSSLPTITLGSTPTFSMMPPTKPSGCSISAIRMCSVSTWLWP
ncbi:MAG: hypothetical protein HC853_11245 [Anaerolineae bacterium]|nr:hypothetical protein [Anaerolineae bacterium]